MTKMHPRSRSLFVCQACGHQTPRWAGRCPDCSQWNSLKEEVAQVAQKGRPQPIMGNSVPATPIDQIVLSEEMRLPTGLLEFDRVLGGGVVPGSVMLVGGDPGIGKTTLLLQALQQLGGDGDSLLYVSGEESPQQIKMRGDRLGIRHARLFVLGETSFEEILNVAKQLQPAALVIDSIQTVYTDQVPSAPGSVAQVQEVACQLMWYAKRSTVPVFIIGHVTKEGMIAGPRLLEHIVDTVLYFEGDKSHAFRILRAVKNRFGATNEIGVFEMKETGLEEVHNPSELFLAGRPAQSTGSVAVSSLEGSRPILVELQALVTPTGYAIPKRMANGVELNRVALLLAVMEKRSGLHVANQDVYVNVVGGMRIDEPSIDLGIVTAVASSLREHPMDSRTLVMGEVGLGGEVRPVNQVELRLREAGKLGFQRCLLPHQHLSTCPSVNGLELIGIRTIDHLLDYVSDYG